MRPEGQDWWPLMDPWGMGGGAGHPRATNALMQIGVLSSEFSSKYLLRGPRFLKSLGQRAPHVRFVPILLQKSQIAERQFSRQKTRQDVIAD